MSPGSEDCIDRPEAFARGASLILRANCSRFLVETSSCFLPHLCIRIHVPRSSPAPWSAASGHGWTAGRRCLPVSGLRIALSSASRPRAEEGGRSRCQTRPGMANTITHSAFHHLLRKTTSSATASGRVLLLPAAHTSHTSVGGDRSTWRSCLTSPRGSGQDVETSARSRWHPDPRARCTLSYAHLFDQRELIVFSLL